jgi:hypothetical protein
MSRPQTKTGKAFNLLLETLRSAEQAFLDPNKGMSGQGILDGYRHLAHLVSYGFDCYLESDPDRPSFVPLATPVKKILGDNADSLYHFTQIRGNRSYRISGRRGNDCYLAFCIYAGKPDGEWSERITANINHRKMKFDEAGNFEIVLTPQPRSDEEIGLDQDSVCVIVRQYFFDLSAAKPAALNIETLETAPPSLPLSDDDLSRRIRAVATFVEHTCRVVPLPSGFSLNELGEPFGGGMSGHGWGTPDNIYSIGSFKLEKGGCLVIEGRSPSCAYWGVQTWNHYMQSFDYRYNCVSINGSKVKLNPDGSFTVVVSAEDPGLHNWVGTAGHNEGMMFCRWLLAGEKPGRPVCRLARIDELKLK